MIPVHIRRQRIAHGVWRGVRTGLMILVAGALLQPSPAPSGQTPAAFVLIGCQFHRRAPEDAGEARLCIRNTGDRTLTTAELTVRILAQKTAGSETLNAECSCVYVKLSPPQLGPNQCGEIVAKLTDPPAANCRLLCDVSCEDGTVCRAIPLAEPALWISFAGFSEDLRRVFVYLENPGQEPVNARLLTVGSFDMAGRAGAIHSPVPPGDKGCLAGDLPSPVTAGEFVHVVVGATAAGQESNVQAVIRAIRDLPIIPEFGGGNPALGLDGRRPFLEIMACPAHGHGTHEDVTAAFLRDYTQRFCDAPGQPVQIAVCRSDMPRAWFRFGDLPDVAAMNPCLRLPSFYETSPSKWFSPFSCVGDLAKKATEPGRFVAIIPAGHPEEEGPFLLQQLTAQERRFLVYCAIASGAKGVIYRGMPDNAPLNQDAFRQLNREIQHLKPLLLIGEPVEWATASANGYAARSLSCGDQAVLIMVFDCRYLSRQRDGRFYTPAFGRTASPVRINVRLPAGATVKDVRTPYASLDYDAWGYRNGVLDFTADVVNSAQVYIVTLQSQTAQLETGQPQ